MEDTWTDEIEQILEKLRVNSVNLSEYHRQQFYYWKSYGKYFRIPVIILASINSTASVGLQTFLAQKWISLISCGIGMVIGIMGSIELYLSIQTSMDLEFKQSKEFYTLAIDIYKMLHLTRADRSEDGKDYLNKNYSYYIKLVEASNLLHKKMKVDVLTILPKKLDNYKGSSLMTSSKSIDNLTESSLEFENIHVEKPDWEKDNSRTMGHLITNQDESENDNNNNNNNNNNNKTNGANNV